MVLASFQSCHWGETGHNNLPGATASSVWNHTGLCGQLKVQSIQLWQKRQVLHSMERWGELQCLCVSRLQARSEVHRVYEANADGAPVNWIVSIQPSSNEQERSRKPLNLRPSRSMLNWSRFGEAKIWADRIASFAVAGVQPIAVHNWSLCELIVFQQWLLHAVSRCVAGPPIDLKFQLCTWCSMLVYKSYILWEHSSVHNIWYFEEKFWILAVPVLVFFFGRSFQLPILVRCPEAFSLLLPFLRANGSIRQVRRHGSNS